jgi:hypothetical protein
MSQGKKSLLTHLLLFAATNVLALGIILILSGIYLAAHWYWNLDLGKIPGVLALISIIAVNFWLLFRKKLK